MARLDYLILGYRIVSVADSDAAKLSSIMIKLGISADLRADGSTKIREHDVDRFVSYANGRIRYELSEPKGISSFFHLLRGRYGLIAGLAFAVFTVIYLSGMVWDVRVVGNDSVSDYRLIDELSTSGFGVGDRWNKIDKNKVEANLLSKFEEISWISINRRGTVAYVEVIESNKPEQQEKWDDGYCNIVAESDGVIEEIVVEQGAAVVSVGDVVRKGDVLISGIIENDQGVYFCAAKGSIKAQSGTTVSAYVPRREVKKRYKRTIISELDLNIFKNTINIFKNYGNPKGEYDIIYDVREYTLFGKYRLPISCMYTCLVEYTEEEVVYTETQMTELAGKMLSGKLHSSFAQCDVIKIKTTGKFENDGYLITSYVVYSAEIGIRSVIGNN